MYLNYLYFKEICRGKQNIEVGLVIDVSATISAKEYLKVKQFAQKIVRNITISPTGNHISYTTFSERAIKEIACNTFTNTDDFANRIANINQHGDFTNIEDCLLYTSPSPRDRG